MRHDKCHIFPNRLTFQITPSMVHKNLVPTSADLNDIFTLGAGGRCKISQRVTINAEYHHIFPGQVVSTKAYLADIHDRETEDLITHYGLRITKMGPELVEGRCSLFFFTRQLTNLAANLRREGDSNPRIPYEINGFRDRPVRPLWHLSKILMVVSTSSTTETIIQAIEVRSLSLSKGTHQLFGGERGIRTPGPLQVNGFQDRRNRPLCHLSTGKSTLFFEIGKMDAGCSSPHHPITFIKKCVTL